MTKDESAANSAEAGAGSLGLAVGCQHSNTDGESIGRPGESRNERRRLSNDGEPRSMALPGAAAPGVKKSGLGEARASAAWLRVGMVTVSLGMAGLEGGCGKCNAAVLHRAIVAILGAQHFQDPLSRLFLSSFFSLTKARAQSMKYKRNKATRRSLGFFGMNFGFRPPFQIICALLCLEFNPDKKVLEF